MTDRPAWLKVRAHTAAEAAGMHAVRDVLSKHHLTTVCQAARCPNAAECWGARTATFMLLGSVCTRACRFCAVPTGNPHGVIDEDEPTRVADAIADLNLAYVVLTSVDRDDLVDGGASLFAAAIAEIKRRSPKIKVEALIPDFSGSDEALRTLIASAPDVIGHNIETVRRLSPGLRDPRAGYDQSMGVLARIREISPTTITKSSLMLGLGEKRSEVIDTLRDLREAGVRALTLGQYLQPSHNAAPLVRYVHPDEFASLADEARDLGFCFVISGPLVRSSYHAAQTIPACSD
ncbi:MAG: lipoyl synthase [Candidatus Bipolaricaulota bacterium]|nr:lipoyl synthase [Candidatus Bipolaricaulota bacterium]